VPFINERSMTYDEIYSGARNDEVSEDELKDLV
jgi:hypothetical protein